METYVKNDYVLMNWIGEIEIKKDMTHKKLLASVAL